jgi:type IV pilus assembly protein PilW
LIELMVALVLGLVVVGAAVSVVLANKQSYRTNEALSQVQESARTAFELLARDLRQAGMSGCDRSGRIANVLLPNAAWWQTWFGLRGVAGDESDPAVATGTAVAERVAGTDSIQLQGIEGAGLTVQSHDPVSATFKISATTSGLALGDVLIACDFNHSALFQVSGYDSSNGRVVHDAGGGSPGNCSKGLGYPTDCSSNSGNVYAFGPNAQIARFTTVDWYVGNNGRASEGGRSLYRRRLGAAAVVMAEEIVSGVSDMQVRYRLEGSDSFVAASAVGAGNWSSVNALTITLTMDSVDARVSTDAGANSGRLQRAFTNVVTLRNRVP